MTAVRTPAVGGKPLAIDMPRHSGKAIKKTRKPEPISDFKVLDNIYTLRDNQDGGIDEINPSRPDGRRTPDSQGGLKHATAARMGEFFGAVNRRSLVFNHLQEGPSISPGPRMLVRI